MNEFESLIDGRGHKISPSSLQRILDSWNQPVRGREQAERLLATLEGNNG